AALPVGNTARSAAPTVGDPGVGDAYEAATTSGRSPSPLLETGRPFTLSERCRTPGMAYRLSQGFGWYSRTPLNASSDRLSVSFTTPAIVPTPIADCAATDEAVATSNAAQRT